MKKKGWKQTPSLVPRWLLTAVKKGLRLADAIGIDEGDDNTWLTIRFQKLPTPKETA